MKNFLKDRFRIDLDFENHRVILNTFPIVYKRCINDIGKIAKFLLIVSNEIEGL